MMANSTLSLVKILAVPGMHVIMNLVYGPSRHKSFVVQRLEHLMGVQKVIGSIPLGDSDFFFVPYSWPVDPIISQVCYVFCYSVQVWQLSVLHHFLSSLNTKHAHNIMPSSCHWVQSCKLLLFVVLERWSGIPFQVVEAVLLIAVTLLLVVQMPQPINLLYWDLHWTGYPSHHLRCHFLHHQMHRGSWILRLIMPLVKIKFS